MVIHEIRRTNYKENIKFLITYNIIIKLGQSCTEWKLLVRVSTIFLAPFKESVGVINSLGTVCCVFICNVTPIKASSLLVGSIIQRASFSFVKYNSITVIVQVYISLSFIHSFGFS